MAKLQGRFNDGQDSTIPPLAVTGLTATDVGTNRPYLATANTTSAASAAGTGGAVTVSWTVPSTSTAATSYDITTTPSTYTANVTAPATSYVFQGLASNTSYTFTITPKNSFGSGLTTTSSSVLSTTVPAAPGTPTATAGVDSDSISWTAVTANGGKAITNYYILGSDNTSGNTTGTSITIADTANTSQYYNVYADNGNGRSAASPNSNTVTTLPPSFFSPPFFPPGFFAPPFFPPGFFAPPFFPPGFFSPPFFCIDEDTPILIVLEDGTISSKKAKDIVIGDKILSTKLTNLEDEFKFDPYTWTSSSIDGITCTDSVITNILEHVKDVTMIINGDDSKRFSLEQTVLIKRNDIYFFGSTGALEIGDMLVERQEDNSFVEIPVNETKLIDEQRKVYEFDAAPNDLLIAGNLVVHNKKIFA